MQLRIRPLSTWPGSPDRGGRKRARFRTEWSKTLRDLDHELGLLAARDFVIELDCADCEIRLDGSLRAQATLRSQRVVISFDSKHGPLRFACGTYDNWRHNVRAICLTLESLRAVDRYGATRTAEQYAGWKQLPPPASELTMNVEQAAEFIAQGTGISQRDVIFDSPSLQKAYVQRAKVLHPDRETGSHDGFVKLQGAVEVVRAYQAATR